MVVLLGSGASTLPVPSSALVREDSNRERTRRAVSVSNLVTIMSRKGRTEGTKERPHSFELQTSTSASRRATIVIRRHPSAEIHWEDSSAIATRDWL